MRVLSLFDGMACGMIAMENSVVHVDQYWAYEIDKYAIAAAKHNYPDIKEMGDVFNADFTEMTGCDFLIGGSPCTYWSIARANSSGREVEAHGIGWDLFQQYVRALRTVRPKWFIYENNKSMSQQVKQSISDAFGFEPICINSSLVSAQNRQRLYWVGRLNQRGEYDKVEVRQPDDKHITVKDILDYDVGQAICVASRGRYNEDGTTSQHFEVRGEKTNALTTVAKDNLCAIPIRVGTYPRADGRQTQGQAYRIYSIDGKSVTLKSNAGGVGSKTGLYAIQSACAEKSYIVKDSKIYINGTAYHTTLKDGNYIVRSLSVNECKRLQTVPDSYDLTCVSNSRAYKLLGNGWTCDVITHIINECVGSTGGEIR